MSAFTQILTQSIYGFKSERNTSDTPLNAAATFTGLSETFASNEVFITVKTDQDGTVFLDFSDDDGVTFETVSHSVTANVYSEIHEFKAARRFRVRFTNTSGSNQTSLSLNTYYGAFDAAGAANAISDVSRSDSTSDTATISSAISVDSTTSTTLLSANEDRVYIAISATDTNIWIKLQAASVDNDKKGIFIPKNFTYELFPKAIYTGEISAIGDTATAMVYTTEF